MSIRYVFAACAALLSVGTALTYPLAQPATASGAATPKNPLSVSPKRLHFPTTSFEAGGGADLPLTVFNSSEKRIKFTEGPTENEFYPVPGGSCASAGTYVPNNVVFTVPRLSHCTIEIEFVADGVPGPGHYSTENSIESTTRHPLGVAIYMTAKVSN